jgi:zinc/manganese transport system permease protein
MNASAEMLAILGPALIAGLLVTAVLVPFGFEVLKRGIVFIDLAVAQIAGVGVIFADFLGWEPEGMAVQVSALSAALITAFLLTWTEKRWPEVQEAVIGVVFVLGASGAILLLASNPHGGEHLKDLLVGQILWVNRARLPLDALIGLSILTLWMALGARLGRIGFYALFACAVTFSVQLVGLYLVFTSLVVPGLATYYASRRRHLKAYAVSLFGYLFGLMLSLWLDLPSGAMIVWTMALVALLAAGLERKPV